MTDLYYLDLRGKSLGGPVVPASLLDRMGRLRPEAELRALPSAGPITFLLHGFNVTRERGRANLEGFADEARRQVKGLQQRCIGVLWPGDDFLSPVTYSLEEYDADRSAAELARTILKRMVGVTRPNFVAHSLGCRVVLETMRLLMRAGVACGEVILMAGAVDNDCLARSTRYASAVRSATRVSVLSSSADWVLRLAFPAGDFIASLLSGGYTRSALGRTGSQPATKPPQSVPINVIDRRIGNFDVGHGDYLPYGPSEPKQRSAARYAAACLDSQIAPIYTLP